MTKLRADCHLYGLGGKGWVELRVGKKPPKATVSTCSKTIQVSERTGQLEPNTFPYQWQYVVRPRKITLSTTTWEGGRVVGSMTDRRYRLLSGVACRNGACALVPATRVNTLLKEVGHA